MAFDSLSVQADFPVNGLAPGTELAVLGTMGADQSLISEWAKDQNHRYRVLVLSHFPDPGF